MPIAKSRVLLVDDEPLLLKAFKRIPPNTFEVVTAESGQEPLECISKDAFDVILCDIMLPDISGDDIYNTVIKDKPELARRFIFITGGTFTPKTNDFIRSTDRPCLVKPIDEIELLDVIQKVIAK